MSDLATAETAAPPSCSCASAETKNPWFCGLLLSSFAKTGVAISINARVRSGKSFLYILKSKTDPRQKCYILPCFTFKDVGNIVECANG